MLIPNKDDILLFHPQRYSAFTFSAITVILNHELAPEAMILMAGNSAYEKIKKEIQTEQKE